MSFDAESCEESLLREMDRLSGGLGLLIASRYAREMGASLELVARAGSGARFLIRTATEHSRPTAPNGAFHTTPQISRSAWTFSSRTPGTSNGGSFPTSNSVRSFPSTGRATPASVTTSSCGAVVHIGDSTSDGLTSADYLPDPAQRIDAQYARVGVTSFDPEISGARSVVERYKNDPNADDVAKPLVGQGYHGCWVLALGTNEAADVAVGSSIGLSERVDRMMADLGNVPVMWVNVKSMVGSGPYAESHMADWDDALVKACAKYPNMRVFDWASVVNDSWFISDGIHFTTPGYAARSQLIADALAKAFPAAGAAPSSCVVR